MGMSGWTSVAGISGLCSGTIGEIRDRLSAIRVRRTEDFYHDVPSWSQKKDFIRVNLPCSGELKELVQALLVELREIANALKWTNRTVRQLSE